MATAHQKLAAASVVHMTGQAGEEGGAEDERRAKGKMVVGVQITNIAATCNSSVGG